MRERDQYKRFNVLVVNQDGKPRSIPIIANSRDEAVAVVKNYLILTGDYFTRVAGTEKRKDD